jgi:hypothetical protein
LNREATMERMARLHTPVEDTCQAVIGDGHPCTVDASHGAEKRVLTVSSHPGDAGLILGAPGQQGADPHGHQRVAAVLESENPLQTAVTRVARDADASARAGEGVPHD